jgi:arabinogalactan endo-1,4-beta-galactosidase
MPDCISQAEIEGDMAVREEKTIIYLGADNSYVNEMEDCDTKYKDKGREKDPFQIFADYKCNLTRVRLWHTPAWYDTLNHGKRYSDFEDVKRTLHRSKDAGMMNLLNYHLSDTWSDPQKQRVPAAWLPVVDNLPVLKDSLYNHIYGTLEALGKENLIPEMVQIGNETNKGILLSPKDDSLNALDWDRNSQLFNIGIKAVRDFEKASGKKILIALHMAAPEEARALLQGYLEHGITDFDIIGISYYWAWHKPTTIPEAAAIVRNMRERNPDKQVIIFETGYPWTLEHNDRASNIINEPHPDYNPPTPEMQLKWLTDLTHASLANGATGVLYWEPAWVSTTCSTPWGKGSHQEHATFFDFDNNVLQNGGMDWFGKDYSSSFKSYVHKPLITLSKDKRNVEIKTDSNAGSEAYSFIIFGQNGIEKIKGNLKELEIRENGIINYSTEKLGAGNYHIVVSGPDHWIGSLGFTKN